MYRKIITILISIFFLSSLSHAERPEISFGIKGGKADLEGTDKTVNTSNKTTRSEDSSFGALFVEGKLPINAPVNISLGLEYIPLEATLDADTTGDDGNGDYEMTVDKHTTLYIAVSKELPNDIEIFGRAGIVRADISNVKSSTNTLTSKDDELEGKTFGLGVQKNLDLPFLSFVRIGYDKIEYDTVQAASSESTYKADGEAEAYYLSIGKTF